MMAELNSSRVILAMAVLAGLALDGCEKGPPPAPPPAPPEVLVMTIAAGEAPIRREWIGTTDGSANADIRARVAGYLTKSLYTEGAFVKTGQPLFVLDDRPFVAALQLAQANLAKDHADQVKTELEANRLKPLVEKGAASKQEYDNAAQANEANKALIKAGEANLEQAKLNLAYTKIMAPIGGIAGIAEAQIGDLVGPANPTPLTTISTVNPIKVYFAISEQEYLAFMKTRPTNNPPPEAAHIPLDLILADGSTWPEKGRFSLADRQVDKNTGTIRLAALFPNPDNVLRPGQFAKISAIVQILPDAIVVPQRAVREVQGKYEVIRITSEKKAQVCPVNVGERIDGGWLITSGLKVGEEIIVEGLQKARPGSPVTPKPYVPQTQPAAPATSAAVTMAPATSTR